MGYSPKFDGEAVPYVAGININLSVTMTTDICRLWDGVPLKAIYDEYI